MVMLTAYFDESESNSPNAPRVHTETGYIATVDKWQEFSEKWQALLDDQNLPPFSMKQFANLHDKIFGNWGEKRKRLFLRILHKFIKEAYLASFSTSVELSAFENLTAPQKLALGTQYSFAAVDCLKRIKGFGDEIGLQEPITYVFEKGSQHLKAIKTLARR